MSKYPTAPQVSLAPSKQVNYLLFIPIFPLLIWPFLTSQSRLITFFASDGYASGKTPALIAIGGSFFLATLLGSYALLISLKLPARLLASIGCAIFCVPVLFFVYTIAMFLFYLPD